MIEELTQQASDFLSLSATGRPGPGIQAALGLLEGGMDVDTLIRDVIAPSQECVGELWESNHWTAAQEHAATAVVDAVLGAVAVEVTPRSERRGTVLVACVEGEYHTVPAWMGVERLRHDGWEVTFLGGSLPAQDLQSFAVAVQHDAVVLSCTVPLFLPGASRCIAALADLGAAAVVAGAGFGSSPRRAECLGASAWIGPDDDATTVLSGRLDPARNTAEVDAGAAELEMQINEIVEECLSEMRILIPQMATYDARQLAHTRADLDYILRYLVVAIMLDDSPLFDDFTRWLAGVLAHRGVPDTVLRSSLDIVTAVTERRGLLHVAALCESARQRLA